MIEQFIKLQQYTFVCAPQPLQWGALAALDVDMTPHINAYREKRDMIYDGLKSQYQVTKPGERFISFRKSPKDRGKTRVNLSGRRSSDNC